MQQAVLGGMSQHADKVVASCSGSMLDLVLQAYGGAVLASSINGRCNVSNWSSGWLPE